MPMVRGVPTRYKPPAAKPLSSTSKPPKGVGTNIPMKASGSLR